MNRLFLTLFVLASLHAADDAVRLMGYDRLDAQGRPIGVVVALPRAQFDDLWSRTHGAARPADPPVQLAIGAQSFVLSLVGDAVEGRLEIPIAVPAPGWQVMRLPLPGAVQGLELLPLSGGSSPPPGRVTWKTEGDQLVVSLAGDQQALLAIQFTRKATDGAGGRRISLRVAPTLGGQARLRAPMPWRPVADGLVLVDGRADLPTAGGAIDLGWQLPAEATPMDSRLSVEQNVTVRLAAGHVAWSAVVSLASAGAPLGSARLVVPSGLILSELAGSGVAGWRQDGNQVVITFAEPAASRQVRLQGMVARSGGSGRAAVTLVVPGAAVSRGRIGLSAADGERFLRPEHAALASAQPIDGEALAVRWDDQPVGLTIAWESLANELSVTRDLALIVGEGRARAVGMLVIAGKGAQESVRIALPTPWRVASIDGATTWAVTGTGAARAMVLSAASPWTSGARINMRLEADRSAFDRSPVIPTLMPLGTGVVAGRLRVAVADAGATRIRLEASDARPLSPDSMIQELLRTNALLLLAGERWRSAAELPSSAAPVVRLTTDAAVTTATLSHYVILGRDGVRWSLHIDALPEQGVIDRLSMRLPIGARLVSVTGVGLGGWQNDQGVLQLRMAATGATPVAIDLELDLPVGSDGAVRMQAPQVDGLRCVQQIALVEEDDLGLIKREIDGLSELESPIARLPDGVERKQIRLLWKAARADWSLGLVREPLAATTGADGLATLVDGSVSVAPDGELRGLATWHVVNRTRQQFPLRVPEGVELWEARVDGHPVRVRRDVSGSMWLPVSTLRPGQASTRVGLVWRSRASGHGVIRLLPPTIGELKVITSVWRIAAPPGWELVRSGGALQNADPAEAAADRAQAVIDEIQRLQAVDGLNEAGLKRLEGQLAVLDSELKDHLISIGQRSAELRGLAAASSLWSSKVQSTTKAISDNGQRLNEMQLQIKGAYGNRADRRRQLNIDQLGNRWNNNDIAQKSMRPALDRLSALDQPARLSAQVVPWDDALHLVGGGGLGMGQMPPGLALINGTALTGIELVREPTGNVLMLRGQGGALDGELVLTPLRSSWRPWLWLCGAVLLFGLAGFCALRWRGPNA
ncbi:MAG: hypothetical protein AAB263_15930 [Planctomycetota bacterium]